MSERARGGVGGLRERGGSFAWRMGRRGLWLGAAASIGIVAVYVVSERELEQRYSIPTEPESLEIEVDGELVERGRHLVTVVAQCSYCHGPDLAGREMADDPWIGRLFASNLTRGKGGVGGRLSDSQWNAAVRHGIDPDGRSLLLMPSAQLARLSDRDLAAVVAYVRQAPAVDRVLPAKRAGWLTRWVVALGLASDLISAQQALESSRAGASDATAALGSGKARAVGRSSGPDDVEATAAYGEYLVALGGCRVCHRADLAGGLHPLSLPGEPVPPDLTRRGVIAGWTRRDFARAMREGRTPEGRILDREFMPWPAFAGLREVEVEAIWLYLRTLDADEVERAREGSELAGREVDPAKS